MRISDWSSDVCSSDLVRATLGLRRQIFFVSMGGFDHHDRLLENQPGLLAELSQALTAFDAATDELGVGNSVTAFTASDFGRTLSSNGDGSDPGWGRSEEHTSELQSLMRNIVCRLLLEK